MPRLTVLDGELLAIDDAGKPSFQLLQNFSSPARLAFIPFDLLNVDGRSLLGLPLELARPAMKTNQGSGSRAIAWSRSA